MPLPAREEKRVKSENAHDHGAIDQLRLSQHGFRCQQLHVCCVAVVMEEAFDDDIQFGFYTRLDRPVDIGMFADFWSQYNCQFAKLFLPHQFSGAVVNRGGSVKRVLETRETDFIGLLVRCHNLLADFNQLVNHLHRREFTPHLSSWWQRFFWRHSTRGSPHGRLTRIAELTTILVSKRLRHDC